MTLLHSIECKYTINQYFVTFIAYRTNMNLNYKSYV